jgi:hypothetical protein
MPVLRRAEETPAASKKEPFRRGAAGHYDPNLQRHLSTSLMVLSPVVGPSRTWGDVRLESVMRTNAAVRLLSTFAGRASAARPYSTPPRT